MKTAVFPGTFNPFTIGHAEIVRLGLNIFDKVVICFSVNPEKNNVNHPENIQRVIEHYSDLIKEGRIEVIETDELTADVAKRYGGVILRGIRDTKDFTYERNMANVNMLLGVQTVFLLADSSYDVISSSNIRELKKHGVDVSKYVI